MAAHKGNRFDQWRERLETLASRLEVVARKSDWNSADAARKELEASFAELSRLMMLTITEAK